MIKKCIVLIAVAGFFAASAAAANEAIPLTLEEQLGKELFFDKISDPNGMSCAACHDPKVGFTGPKSGINQHGAVYKGAVPERFGNRKPPSAAYAALAPVFHYDDVEGLLLEVTSGMGGQPVRF